MYFLERFVIDELGFTLEEMKEISDRFFCSLNEEDWESIEFIEEHEVEVEDDCWLKLSTGRVVFFNDKLLRKDLLAQID